MSSILSPCLHPPLIHMLLHAHLSIMCVGCDARIISPQTNPSSRFSFPVTFESFPHGHVHCTYRDLFTAQPLQLITADKSRLQAHLISHMGQLLPHDSLSGISIRGEANKTPLSISEGASSFGSRRPPSTDKQHLTFMLIYRPHSCGSLITAVIPGE